MQNTKAPSKHVAGIARFLTLSDFAAIAQTVQADPTAPSYPITYATGKTNRVNNVEAHWLAALAARVAA